MGHRWSLGIYRCWSAKFFTLKSCAISYLIKYKCGHILFINFFKCNTSVVFSYIARWSLGVAEVTFLITHRGLNFSFLDFSDLKLIHCALIEEIAYATDRLCPLRNDDVKGATYGINNMQPAGWAVMSGFRVNGAFYAVSR